MSIFIYNLDIRREISMQKVDGIKKLCSDILYPPGILCPEIRDHLSISAGIIEDDITKEGCSDWFSRSTTDTICYILDKLEHCSEETQSILYFLLIEMTGTVH
jgi:hypothetical protein